MPQAWNLRTLPHSGKIRGMQKPAFPGPVQDFEETTGRKSVTGNHFIK
jgi:hypothetical protein